MKVVISILAIIILFFSLIFVVSSQAQAAETNIYYWKISILDINGNIIKEIKTKCDVVTVDNGAINFYNCNYNRLRNSEEYYIKGNYIAEKYLYDK